MLWMNKASVSSKAPIRSFFDKKAQRATAPVKANSLTP